MTDWNRLEGPFLQPERVAKIFRRLGHILFAAVALRLIRLMANTAVRGWLLLLLVFPRDGNELWLDKRSNATHHFQVSLMWKVYSELADEISSWPGSVVDVAQTRKQESHSVARRNRDVAIRTDLWRGPLAREELLPVAIETRSVLGKLGHVGKSSVAFANFFPIGGGNFVARITRQLFFRDVSGVRKL